MNNSRRRRWLLASWLWACGLTLAIGSGCQLEPNLPAAPVPYYPKELFDLMPWKKPAPDYALSEEVAGQTPQIGPKAPAK